MRRFLYYFPGLKDVSTATLKDRGVADRFATHDGKTIAHTFNRTDTGPAGPGYIVAAGADLPAYEPDHQRWIEGAAGYWVGMDTLRPPGPGDLVRRVGIVGYETAMADGQEWRVPLIRRWDADKKQHVPNVPQRMAVSAAGGVTLVVMPEYEAVDALAARVFADCADGRELPLENLMRDGAALLGVNYRIGVEECGLLGLFDETTAVTVMHLAVDLPRLESQAREMSRDGLQHSEPLVRAEE